MTDKIPSFKEEIDDIHVPIDKLDAIIVKTVQGSVPIRKRSLRNKLLYSAGAAVAAVGLLIGSATISPVMATIVSQIPIIGSIFSGSGDRGLKQVSELGLTQVMGQSKTVGGNTITIDEVFHDGTRFTVGYSLASGEPLGEFYLGSGPHFTIDGKSIAYSGSSGETVITPTYRTGISSIDPLTDLAKEFDLGLSFEGEDGKLWKFTIPVKAQSDVELVTIDHAQQAGEIDLTVSNLKKGPAGLLINFNAESGEDDHLASFLNFRIIDDSGNEIVSNTGGISTGEIVNGKEYWKGDRLFAPIDVNVKELTITPYLALPSGGGGARIDLNGNETIIDFKPYEGGGIEFTSFKVKLP